MNLIQTLRESSLNVLRNKFRTALTMLGLIIGIASVIVLVGIGDGSNEQVAKRIQSLGGDVISAYTYNNRSLDYKDIERIRESENVLAVSPSKFISADVTCNHTKLGQASVTAADEQYLDARNLSLERGRNLSAIDRTNKSKVCIVGQKIAKDLGGDEQAVGKTLKLNGHIFTIVGIIRSQGESMGTDTGKLVAIPLTVAPELGADMSFNEAYARAANEQVDAAKADLASYFSNERQLSPNHWTVNTQDELINATSSVNKTMSALLGGIASISLLVAGIGVMNVMLVSVAERVREIGIKKALGARRIDIMGQFLTESLIISVLGGSIGILCGLGFGFAATQTGVAFAPSPAIVAVAAATSIGIGLVFGLVPAYRAAALNPIDALK
ncbi:ABC transporter permease [Curtanaerobium respiraculi]|uniref:ABC transporter permease n=1 Tax=Curtanaerobium respiraculi TaxID=2949669 RepID=UPI0024B39FC0|nr:ABC transporter permease [Curtanaerobium respiraculi]